MRKLLIRWTWRLLHQLSDDYEWVIYIDSYPRMTYAGWVDNPTEILDMWIEAMPNAEVTMVRRLKSPAQVKLG